MTALTIPAPYLEDVRAALIREIKDDSDALQNNQERLGDSTFVESVGREDRSNTAGNLRDDLRALDQLLDADDDTEITAEAETLFSMFESMSQLLAERLTTETNYAPVEMLAVLWRSARSSRARWRRASCCWRQRSCSESSRHGRLILRMRATELACAHMFKKLTSSSRC